MLLGAFQNLARSGEFLEIHAIPLFFACPSRVLFLSSLRFSMKRSKSPSVLFANKAPRMTKEEKDAPPVNHLAIYQPKKVEVKEEKENEEPSEEIKGITKKGKNIGMTATSPPIYFLVYYKSKKKFDDTKQGHGMVTNKNNPILFTHI